MSQKKVEASIPTTPCGSYGAGATQFDLSEILEKDGQVGAVKSTKWTGDQRDSFAISITTTGVGRTIELYRPATLAKVYCLTQSFEVVDTQPVQSLLLTDLNEDGQADLAYSNNSAHQLNVHFWNNGTKSLSTTSSEIQLTAASDLYGHNLAAGDLDGDGDIDLMLSRIRLGTFDVRLQDAGGIFQESSTGSFGTLETFQLQLADVNGDSHLDAIAAGWSSNKLRILSGVGDGTFGGTLSLCLNDASGACASGDEDIMGTAVADFNNDGRLDLASFGDYSGGAPYNVGIFLQETLSYAFQVSIFAFSRLLGAQAKAYDFDDDGFDDLQLSRESSGQNQIVLMRGLGNSSFSEERSFNTVDPYTDSTTLDADGDSETDLIVASVQGSVQLIEDITAAP
jgi:hypothetical protein